MVMPLASRNSERVMGQNYAQCVVSRNEEFRDTGLGVRWPMNKTLRMPKRSRPISAETKAAQANLRLWRKSRNLTLAALAEQIGSKTSTLSGWEKGVRAVDLEDLRQLAAFYGVPVAALLLVPKEGGPMAGRMARAAGRAAKMTEADAEEWLKLGERFETKTPPEG